jgi:heme/copper-type cytochrome/quinol oxidase subunit 1
MQVDQISNVDAILGILGILVFAWLVTRLVPSAGEREKVTFSEDEIHSYDGELPKYFLVAALALILGGLHTVVKNLPGFWQWLWEAGYGGHLFRDLSNSHIIIVGGGTVLLTAFTWYALPRFVNRPLYSELLARGSFWLTVIGVFGFYAAWLSLGLVEGSMVRHGWTYVQAKAALGNWHRLPTAITSSIMGFGYWSYVLNVFLTVFAARHVAHKKHNYLTKFAVVSASALFIGTVQGVIQVMPDNADWIHAAGTFGNYVDPISHAHINLVTGMMVSLAAFLVFFAPRLSRHAKPISRRVANALFWTLVPGSLLFYLAFLLLGLILGGDTLGYGGLQLPALAPLLHAWRAPLLALGGTVMLAGFWLYFLVLWRHLDLRRLKEQLRAATPAAFWLVSSLALVIGTFQGLLQVVPATARILTVPEEVPNIHAQLNMIGGVLLALIGLVYLLLPELLGVQTERRLRRVTLFSLGGGIGAYYLTTLATGLLRYVYLWRGLDNVQAAARLGWVAPALLLLTALPMLIGYLSFGLALWRATPAYRARWLHSLRTLPTRYSGTGTRWQRRAPTFYFLAIEAVSAGTGFPGLGWMLAGYALPGLPLLLAGPAIAWALLPILSSPYGDGPLSAYGLLGLVVYLASSMVLSVGALALTIRQTAAEARA